jgi:hypothetical protein
VGLTLLSTDRIGLQGLGIEGSILPPAPLGRIGVYGHGDDTGVFGDGPTGVLGTSTSGTGVWGSSGSSVGVLGTSYSAPYPEPTGAHGVYGLGDDTGVSGHSSTGTGALGTSASGYGIAGASLTSHGVHGETTGNWGWVSGVYGKASQSSANGVTGWNTGAGVGVYGYSKEGTAGFFTDTDESSGVASVKIKHRGVEGAALELQNWDPGGSDEPGLFIEAIDESNVRRFVVAYNGNVVAADYITWNSDFAEMLPAVEGPEPGDLLAIGADGKLTRSGKAYQTSVAGVYSTAPGFVGGQPMAGPLPGTIPLAVVGVVPVKVSTENGAINPGDLLVASSLPGYAMKAGANPPQGSVVGKAMEALEMPAETGIIQMLATLQ